MRELKATVIIAVLAALAVSSGCSKKHGTGTPASTVRTYSVSVAAEKVKGGGLRLLMNGNNGDALNIFKNQTYLFKTRLVSGEPYDITVEQQPTEPSQTCTMTKGTGVVNGRNINAVVTCTTNKYTVGGTVTGLDGEVIIHNNVPLKPYDILTLDASGPFTFGKDITDESNYSLSIFRQPSVQTCTFTKGSGTLKGADVNNVVLSCVDNVPTISLKGDSIVEGDTGTKYLEFTVKLSLLARQDVTVDYASTDGTATVVDGDYLDATGQLTISAGTSSGTIAVPVVGDTNPEPNETLTLTLTNPSVNATFGDASITSLTAMGTIYNDDGGALNDTGITGCANADTNNLACSTPGNGTGIGTVGGTATYPGQDAEFGRDVTVNDDTDGHAGFSFQKIDANGNVTTDCVKDLTTKLTWELKTTDSISIHNKDWTYSWYDTDSTNNGGDPGTPGDLITSPVVNSCGGTLIACDTEKLVAAVNSDGLCGYHDWRLPTAEELSSLIDSSLSSGPTIDVGWFPNTINAIYWTASPYASYSQYAWGIDFSNGGIIGSLQKKNVHYVRLVRSGP